MCIYCTTNNYRKIYEHHHGPIPKDEQGKTFHIHHMDGNHSNNHPDNLKAVSNQEHYDIHYAQGDWAACHRLGYKINLSADEISELARRNAVKRVQDGTHNFLSEDMQRRRSGISLKSSYERVINGIHNFLGGEISRRVSQERVANGTHNFLGGELQRRLNKKRVEEGTHHFLGGEISRRVSQERVANGTHNFLSGKISRRGSRERVDNGTHHFLGGEIQRRVSRERVDNGTHHLLGPEHNQKRINNGTHNFLVEHTCPHCGKVGKSASMFYWHFDKCKHKK
jgi:hypothetical protein